MVLHPHPVQLYARSIYFVDDGPAFPKSARSLESMMINYCSSTHIEEQCPLALCNQYGKGTQSKVQVIIFEPSRCGVRFLSQSSVGTEYSCSVPLTELQPGARRDETRAGAAIDKI